jgi:GrpB-like predicted nucleotidyltransferase (UPF0157 family)
MKLGVKRGTVKIQEYSTNWNDEFLKEKTTLLGIFKENHLDIQHVGSTAVPNLSAKPLIDIAIQIQNIDILNDIPAQLKSIGYVERIGRLSGKQKVFAKGTSENVTHHLHIIEVGEIDWEEKIRFRDILIENPKLAVEYTDLKKNLAAKNSTNRSNYTKGKAQFIRKLLDQ